MRWTLHAVLASLVIVSALNGGQERMRRPSNTGVPATAAPLVISLLQESHDIAGQLAASARSNCSPGSPDSLQFHRVLGIAALPVEGAR